MSSQNIAACGCPCVGYCGGVCDCPCFGFCESSRLGSRQPFFSASVPQTAGEPSTSNNAPVSSSHPQIVQPQPYAPQWAPGPSTFNNNPPQPRVHFTPPARTPPTTNYSPNSPNNLPAPHQQNEQRSTSRTSRRSSRSNSNSPNSSQSRQSNDRSSSSPYIHNYAPVSASTSAASTNCLHPLLMYTVLPRLDLDFRFSPSEVWQCRDSILREDLSQSAVHPPIPELKLTIPHLPQWPIHVVPTEITEGGVYYVSIRDVFEAIYFALRVPLSRRDYNDYPKRFPHPDAIRKKSHIAFYARCRDSHRFTEEMSQGMRRVDFLMGRTRFRGLARSDVSSTEWVLLHD